MDQPRKLKVFVVYRVPFILAASVYNSRRAAVVCCPHPGVIDFQLAWGFVLSQGYYYYYFLNFSGISLR